MRYNGNHIENPVAYENAIQGRIKANASKTRRRKLEAAAAQDSAEFRYWLLSTNGWNGLLGEEERARLQELGDRYSTSQPMTPAEWDEFEALRRKAQELDTAFRKQYGWPARFLMEAMDNWGGLTDGQLAFARKQFAEKHLKAEERAAREAERRANAQPWTAGRQEVVGVIRSTKVEEFAVNRWASSITVKGLIETADGRKLWTSIPKTIWEQLEGTFEELAPKLRGLTVKFTVKVEPKQDDPTFAFGSRPTSGEIINEAA
jgi:hypothetical protein